MRCHDKHCSKSSPIPAYLIQLVDARFLHINTFQKNSPEAPVFSHTKNMKYVGMSWGLNFKFIKRLLETEHMQINNIKQPLDWKLAYTFYGILKGGKVMITVAPNRQVKWSSKDRRILQTGRRAGWITSISHTCKKKSSGSLRDLFKTKQQRRIGRADSKTGEGPCHCQCWSSAFTLVREFQCLRGKCSWIKTKTTLTLTADVG